MKMKFFKYQGTGNDFVLIDNRENSFNGNVGLLCDRKFGIGADGLMLLENAEGFDFRMVYYNSDGNESTMCGNGGRCIVAFAKYLGIINDNASFIAIDGPHAARIDSNNQVSLGMIGVKEVEQVNNTNFVLNTGSPHYVQFKDNVSHMDLVKDAQGIRHNNRFSKEGINVNFVEQQGDVLKVRTYERGVEDETLSCGTGVTAVAIAFHEKNGSTEGHFSQKIKVQGGQLEVNFTFSKEIGYKKIQLIGPTEMVFSGEIESKPL